MTDVFSPEKRSWIMARIKSKNTIAELLVFKFLRSRKIYFQKHYRFAMGTPDIAQLKRKRAIFIDGDFWHGRHKKDIKRLPRDYWQKKIEANVRRDVKTRKTLLRNGWKILRVWEKDIISMKSRQKTFSEVLAFLNSVEPSR